MPSENVRSVTMFNAVFKYPRILICVTVQHVPLTLWSHIIRGSVHCNSTVRTQPKVYIPMKTWRVRVSSHGEISKTVRSHP
jgi:hypothetical protein